MKKRIVRLFTMAGVMMLLVALMAMPAYAAGGNVSGAIEGHGLLPRVRSRTSSTMWCSR